MDVVSHYCFLHSALDCPQELLAAFLECASLGDLQLPGNGKSQMIDFACSKKFIYHCCAPADDGPMTSIAATTMPSDTLLPLFNANFLIISSSLHNGNKDD